MREVSDEEREEMKVMEGISGKLWDYYVTNDESILDSIVCRDLDALHGIGGETMEWIRKSSFPQGNMEGLILYLARALKEATRQVYSDGARFAAVSKMAEENDRLLETLQRRAYAIHWLTMEDHRTNLSPEKLEQWSVKDSLRQTDFPKVILEDVCSTTE